MFLPPRLRRSSNHGSADVRFRHVDVEDGEEHELGNVRLSILHSPGRTPVTISILVTDRTRATDLAGRQPRRLSRSLQTPTLL
jgi:hypothetical protein